DRRANRGRGRLSERAPAEGHEGRPARGRIRDALQRPGVRAPDRRGPRTRTRSAGPGRGPRAPGPGRPTGAPGAGPGGQGRGGPRGLGPSGVAAVEPGPEPQPLAAAEGEVAEEERDAHFAGDWVRTRVLRGEPASGVTAEGPCVFELPEATLVLPPGWSASV